MYSEHRLLPYIRSAQSSLCDNVCIKLLHGIFIRAQIYQACKRINRLDHFGMHFLCSSRVRGLHQLNARWLLEAVLSEKIKSFVRLLLCSKCNILNNKVINNHFVHCVAS